MVIDIMSLFAVGFWQSRLMKLGISLVLPVAFLVAYWKVIHKNREFWFVFIMLVMALGISWCCHETGPRADHGSFGWQVVSAMWFVYYLLKVILKESTQEGGIVKSEETTNPKEPLLRLSKTAVFLLCIPCMFLRAFGTCLGIRLLGFIFK